MQKFLDHGYRHFRIEFSQQPRLIFFENAPTDRSNDRSKTSADVQAEITKVNRDAKSEIPRMILQEGKTVGDATKEVMNTLDGIKNKYEILQFGDTPLTESEKNFNNQLDKYIADGIKELADSQANYQQYEKLAGDITTIEMDLATFEPTGPVREQDLGNPAAVKLIVGTLRRFEGYRDTLKATNVPGFEPTLTQLKERTEKQIGKFQDGLDTLYGKAGGKLTEVDNDLKWLPGAIKDTPPDANADARSTEIGEKVAKLGADRIVLRDLAALIEASGNQTLLSQINAMQKNVENALNASGLLDPKKDGKALRDLNDLRQKYEDAKNNYLRAQYPKERGQNYYKNLEDAKNRLAFTETQYRNAHTRYAKDTTTTVHDTVYTHVLRAQRDNIGRPKQVN